MKRRRGQCQSKTQRRARSITKKEKGSIITVKRKTIAYLLFEIATESVQQRQYVNVALKARVGPGARPVPAWVVWVGAFAG